MRVDALVDLFRGNIFSLASHPLRMLGSDITDLCVALVSMHSASHSPRVIASIFGPHPVELFSRLNVIGRQFVGPRKILGPTVLSAFRNKAALGPTHWAWKIAQLQTHELSYFPGSMGCLINMLNGTNCSRKAQVFLRGTPSLNSKRSTHSRNLLAQ
jgi:hypothetical protein